MVEQGWGALRASELRVATRLTAWASKLELGEP